MPKLRREYYPAEHGHVTKTIEWDEVRVDSFVVATVSECEPHGVMVGDRRGGRFLGAAPMSVQNVVPYDGGVTVRILIDWGGHLPFAVDYVLFDD